MNDPGADPVLIGVLCTVLGIVVGVVAMLGFRAAESRHTHRASFDLEELPAGTTEVLSALGRAYVIVDAGRDVVKASPSSYALGLVRGHQLVHQHLVELVDSMHADSTIVERPVHIPSGDHETRELTLRAAPLDESFTLLLAEDRTELARSQAVRQDFVANVSHELKTPVGAIRLLAEALEDASDDSDMVEHFSGRLSNEAIRLSTLIQDIIELSRVQSANMVNEAVATDTNDVVATAIAQTRTEADAKSMRIHFTPGEPTQVFGNFDQLVMAVRNLIINAVHYSPEDTDVTVSNVVVEDLVEISIADQGPGLTQTDQERIFERFFRVDGARTRTSGPRNKSTSPGGTGLGLSIVKHVLANHGGEIIVDSEVGRGSKFTIRLPEMLEADTPELTQIAEPPGEHR